MESAALTEPSERDQQQRRQRMRSVAIGLALGALVILFYAATIVRLGPNALNREGARFNEPQASDCKKAGTC